MSYSLPHDPPLPSPFSHALTAEFTTTGVAVCCVPKAIAERHWEAFSVALTVAPKMKASGWRPNSHNHKHRMLISSGRWATKRSQKWKVASSDGRWWSIQGRIIFVWLTQKYLWTANLDFFKLWLWSLKYIHFISLFILFIFLKLAYFKLFEPPHRPINLPLPFPMSHLGLSQSLTLPRPIARVVPDHKHQ